MQGNQPENRGTREGNGHSWHPAADRILVVSSASDDFVQGLNEVDAICDNLAEIPSFVERLAKHACTPPDEGAA